MVESNVSKKQEIINKITNQVQKIDYRAIWMFQNQIFYGIDANWDGITRGLVSLLFYYAHEIDATTETDTTSDPETVTISSFSLPVFYTISLISVIGIIGLNKRRK